MKFFQATLLAAAIACAHANALAEGENVPAPAPSATILPASAEKIAKAEFEKIQIRVAEKIADETDLPAARVPEICAYARALFERSASWNVPENRRADAISALATALAFREDDETSDALDAFDAVALAFPETLFAAEALFQKSVIYTLRRQFEEAFENAVAVVETYPGSDRVGAALAQGYLVAETVRAGVRPRRFGGRLPWLKDRHSVLKFYEKLYALEPNAEIAPRLLYRKGVFAASIADEWFESDRKGDAIDALERLISGHPESPLVPESYLLLAATYESLCVGAEWDQVSSRRALNYYTDFYSLFPEHEKAEFAYEKTEELRNLLAANRVAIGDFYYSGHNNLRAAVGFYREAITYAPDSPAGLDAKEKIEKIRRGERAPRTIIDWLFGRYPSPITTDFLDAPSQKSLDAMGFQSAGSLEDDRATSATPSGTAEKQEYNDPSEK